MRPIAFVLVAAGFAVPAWADEPTAPFTERDLSAVDVAATPASDLNIRRTRIPAQLISAQQKPYDLTGLSECPHIAAEVGELDAILGEDLDVAEARRRRPSAGRLAQWAVGSFIPFRGAIREISGANSHERRMTDAIQAGLARRAFLKGVGEAKGCLYPARSATTEVLAARDAERKSLADARRSDKRGAKAKPETRLTLASQEAVKP